MNPRVVVELLRFYSRALQEGKTKKQAMAWAVHQMRNVGWDDKGKKITNKFLKMGTKNDPPRKKALEQRKRYLEQRHKVYRKINGAA